MINSRFFIKKTLNLAIMDIPETKVFPLRMLVSNFKYHE